MNTIANSVQNLAIRVLKYYGVPADFVGAIFKVISKQLFLKFFINIKSIYLAKHYY